MVGKATFFIANCNYFIANAVNYNYFIANVVNYNYLLQKIAATNYFSKFCRKIQSKLEIGDKD